MTNCWCKEKTALGDWKEILPSEILCYNLLNTDTEIKIYFLNKELKSQLPKGMISPKLTRNTMVYFTKLLPD